MDISIQFDTNNRDALADIRRLIDFLESDQAPHIDAEKDKAATEAGLAPASQAPAPYNQERLAEVAQASAEMLADDTDDDYIEEAHALADVALDSQKRLIPYDARIHTGGNDRLMADGKTWKKRRQPKGEYADKAAWEAFVRSVEDELAGGQPVTVAPAPAPSVFADPSPIPADPEPEAPAPAPAAPAPAPATSVTFPQIMARFTKADEATKASIIATVQALGIGENVANPIPLLATPAAKEHLQTISDTMESMGV